MDTGGYFTFRTGIIEMPGGHRKTGYTFIGIDIEIAQLWYYAYRNI